MNIYFRPSRFNLSDLLCYVLIVGTIPAMLGREPNERLLSFILAALIETPAAYWAVEILGVWPVKRFVGCLAVHIYALLAGSCVIVFPMVCIVILMSLFFPKGTSMLLSRRVWILCVVSGAGAVSAFFVEKIRRQEALRRLIED